MQPLKNKRYLKLLAREYPTVQSAKAEIINLHAILNLPKGTEHFMSDIHGEHEAFLHILNNASGAVCVKIDEVYESTLTAKERMSLASLIYYPAEKLFEAKQNVTDLRDWYRVNLHRLVQVSRLTASKYSRSYVRKALPKAYAYIMEELLNSSELENRQRYHENIISAIIDTDSADSLIMAFSAFIKRTAVDCLHIVGDIFDRGPHADVILDKLMAYHRVDIEWGNHDVLWMGAAAGNGACVAAAVKNCVQYDNLDMLENDYGVNLLPLALFATETYEDASVFEPRKLPKERFKPRDMNLYARMHKAISVILFKLEGQMVKRHPEYAMEDRDLMGRVDWSDYTLTVDGVKHPLRDRDFPTVDPSDPCKLSPGEEALMEQLQLSFRKSFKLQSHVRFLYSVGSIYRCHNGNLLYHGCIPTEASGDFMAFTMEGQRVFGKAYLDLAEKKARQGYFAPDNSFERRDGGDYLWFLWCGRNSPIFGRSHIATFERALIEDQSTWVEPKNPYYSFYNNEDYCRKILADFGLDKPWSRIINGHIPVKVKSGEDPRKANGRLIVIDGGFCQAYHKQTGIAGYTMFFNSHGMRISSHEPFTNREDMIKNEKDITSHSFLVEEVPERIMIADTDDGAEIKARIEDLMALVEAYKNGSIKAKGEE